MLGKAAATKSLQMHKECLCGVLKSLLSKVLQSNLKTEGREGS